MADAKPPEPQESEAAPPSSPGELASAWSVFRSGGVPLCRVDGGPLALAVDGSENAYRFVCVTCGVASSWFEADAGVLRVRGPRTPTPGATE